MARGAAIPAKLVRPTQAGTYRRARLFSLLDRCRSVCWVSGPPGAGKTTLVASYVEARRLRTLWYQLDEGDADVATLFYYLRQAAVRASPRRRWRLPLLTPEYLAGLGTFTRRWFEELFAGLSKPFVLVFDNYHDVATNSPLHDLLRNALETLPAGGRVVVVSRADPPPTVARLRAEGRVALIEWEALRLSPQETAAIARARSHGRLAPERARALHAATDGWAAGLVLMLERTATRKPSTPKEAHLPQAVFDYFASEILAHSDTETRRVLLETAILPKVTATQAAKLTGTARAGEILAELARRRYFTDRHSEGLTTYQYHPLFREFLLARAQDQLTAERRREIRRDAATLLESSGQVEDAAEFLRHAEDWEGLARLALTHAPTLLRQGRVPTVTVWLRSLPPALLAGHPWLLVWSGICALSSAPESSHLLFALAFEHLSEQDDGAGALTSWAGAVDSIVLQFADAHRLDRWLERVPRLCERYLARAPAEIEFWFASSVVAALAFRAPFADQIGPWLAKAERLVSTGQDVARRAFTAYHLGFFAVWLGDLRRASAAREMLREMERSPDASPLARILALYVEAHAGWLTGELARSTAAIEAALEIGATTGVHLMDRQAFAIGLYAALSAGDLSASARLLERMGQGLDPARLLDASHYRYVAAWSARLRGDAESAVRLLTEALEQTMAAGVPFPSALCHHGMALLRSELGDPEGARAHLEQARAIGRRMNSQILECSCLLAEAEIAYARGDAAAGRAALAAAFGIGRREGYGNVHWWRSDAASLLCARALEAGIEVEYVQGLISSRALEPPAGELPEAWPWRIRVHALGRFDVQVGGQPVAVVERAQRKPLELLQALVAFGGRAVTERQLADALWPDADGDLAQQSLAVTLHRLRRLLRDDESVRRHEGQLDLDPRRIWVDVAALDACLGKAANADPHDRARLVDQALRLYRGPLLAGHDAAWTVAPRERVRARFVRELGEVARACETAGDNDRAIGAYLRALEVDDRAEELYRRLMAVYARLGRRAEMLALYQRCRATLKTALGVPPSPETEAILRSAGMDLRRTS